MTDTETLFARDATPFSVLGTAPSANTEITQTVPAGQLWDLIAVTVVMTQGITQTPQPILQFTDGTNVLFELPGCTAAQTASTTCRYSWSRDYSTITAQIGSGANCRASAPLPEGLILRPGYQIKTVTIGLGANSQYGQPVFYLRQGVHN